MNENPDRVRRGVLMPAPTGGIVISGARNCHIFGEDGKKYLDMTSGWNVANVGWSNPRVIRAAAKQLNSFPFRPSWCESAIERTLVYELSEIFEKSIAVIRATTGTEAVEMALKAARNLTGRQAVIGVAECYHGSTLDSSLSGGVSSFHNEQRSRSMYRLIPVPDRNRGHLDDFAKSAVKIIETGPPPAAILFEPIMTNPGVIMPTSEYWDTIVDAARTNGAMIIVDEVGTGFSRTGYPFAYQNYAFTPDIVCVAKALGGAVAPIAAAVILHDGDYVLRGLAFDSTFAWTPLACAAAVETLSVLSDKSLTARSSAIGDFIQDKLRENLGDCSSVSEVRGAGLEIAIELVDAVGGPIPSRSVRTILMNCRQLGVFVESSRYTTSILVMPPLTISNQDAVLAAEIIAQSIRSVVP